MRFLVRLVAAVIVLAALTVGVFAGMVLSDRSLPAATTQVVVPRGSALSEIASQLADAHVIKSALAFRILARVQRADSDVRAGAYRFPPSQSMSDILRALETGGAQVATWITVPEGFTIDQIAQRLQDNGIGQADETARAFRQEHLEGYLFPSTYLVPLDATPAMVARQMNDEFIKELPTGAPGRAKTLGITIAQGVTVASLVEREAKVDSDRPLIAGVIYNRLRLHMPLQIDATIEYALPAHKAELSYADLKIDSPYNTYTHEGLPPTPIANPGLPSLDAAFNPAHTDALYYVYCGNGHHVFAKTLAEHQANVSRCLH